MDLTPISGLPDGRLLTALEADTSARNPDLSETERAELARLRSVQHVIWRVLDDTAAVLQHARDCVTSEFTRNRCAEQQRRVWAAQTLVERGARS